MTGCSLEFKAKQTLSSMSCFSQSILSQIHKTHKKKKKTNHLEQLSVIEIIEMCRQDIKLTEKKLCSDESVKFAFDYHEKNKDELKDKVVA